MSKKDRYSKNNILYTLKPWMDFLNIILVTPVRIYPKYDGVKININKCYLIYAVCLVTFIVSTEIVNTVKYLPIIGYNDFPAFLLYFGILHAKLSAVIVIVTGFRNRNKIIKILRNFRQLEEALNIMNTKNPYQHIKRIFTVQFILTAVVAVQRMIITLIYFGGSHIHILDYATILFLTTLFDFFNIVNVLRYFYKYINANIQNLTEATGKNIIFKQDVFYNNKKSLHFYTKRLTEI